MAIIICLKGKKFTFEDPEYAIAIVDSNQGDLAVDIGHWKKFIEEEYNSRDMFQIAQQLYSKVLENTKASNWANKSAVLAFSGANLGHVEIWLEEKSYEKSKEYISADSNKFDNRFDYKARNEHLKTEKPYGNKPTSYTAKNAYNRQQDLAGNGRLYNNFFRNER